MRKKTGATITCTDDVAEGVKGLDVIYTGVWVTMGDTYDMWEERINTFKPFQVNAEMMALTGNQIQNSVTACQHSTIQKLK